MMKNYSAGKNHYKFKNIDGKKFGELIVLDSYTKNKKVLVQCSCTNIFEVSKSYLISNKRTSCGKGLCNRKIKNLTGQKFGYLMVIKYINSTKTKKSNYVMWECLCDCGNIVNVHSNFLQKDTKKSCGCKSSIFADEKILKPNNFTQINSIINTYKKCAIKADRQYSLTYEEFSNLINRNCHYCNREPSNSKPIRNRAVSEDVFMYNGIDRVNSNLGYTKDNCVTCCKNCNFAKNNLSYNDFMNLIKKIYEKHNLSILS